jgi:putative transposase
MVVSQKALPNTYTQSHVHFVFAVKFRAALIQPTWKEELHKYVTSIVHGNKHKMLQINSMPDHIHILVGTHPGQSFSSLVQRIKTETSKWINARRLTPATFAWQEGFAAFSYSKSHLPYIIRYIQNQNIHHRKQSFLDEYKACLKAFDIAFEEEYIFNELI